MTRNFESGPARRERTLITAGFVGYSGAGKTFSMMRFAAGMAECQGGKTVVVDTNLRRCLHYAPKPGEQAARGQTFDFEAVHLTPPFSPDDFGEAFACAIGMGATRIVVDSMSDEWEGDGGVLSWHDRLTDEMVQRQRAKGKGRDEADWEIAARVSDLAWQEPKAAHLKLRLWMWQQPVHWLLGYRAKKKIDRKTKERKELGWQPIGADDIVYDLLFKCLLPPAGDGHPIWKPKEEAEQLLVKHPGQFRALFAAHPQVNEELGYQVARWAAGQDIEIRQAGSPTAQAPSSRPAVQPSTPRDPTAALVSRLDTCTLPEVFEQLRDEIKAAWEAIPVGESRTRVKRAIEAAAVRVEATMSAGGAPPA